MKSSCRWLEVVFLTAYENSIIAGNKPIPENHEAGVFVDWATLIT
jgi:hypothetical protein